MINVFHIIDTSLPPLVLNPGSTVVVENWDFSTAWGVGSIKNTDEGSSDVGPKRGVFYKAFCCKPRQPDNTDDAPKPIKDQMDLQSSTYKGKDYLFISNIKDHHRCAICLSLACSAVQSSCCGCTFCSECIRGWKSQHTPPTCPKCRQAVTEVPDRRNEMEISNLELVCPNHESGCEWKGALGKVDNHLEKSCDYIKVECAKHCGKKILKKNTTEHDKFWCPLRYVKCPFCSPVFGTLTLQSDILTYKALTAEHYKVCSKWPILCPNKCSEMYDFNRTSLRSHICPNKIVPCEFVNFGCSQQMQRSEMSKHIRSGTVEHLLMMKGEIDRLKRQNTELRETVALLSQILRQKLSQKP